MEYFFAILMLIACLLTMRLAMISKDGGFNLLGVTGLFSIGYYVLPVFFKSHSGLDMLSEGEVSNAVGMSLLFFVFVIIGNFLLLKTLGTRVSGVRIKNFDLFFFGKYKFIFFICFFVWLIYFSNADLTSYSAEDFEAFFHERSRFSGLLAALSVFSVSGMAVSIALAMRDKKYGIANVMLLLYCFTVLLLLSTGQRLAVISPIFILVAVLSVFGFQDKSLRFVLFGVALLLVISPFMVFVREFQGAIGKDKIVAASQGFAYGGDFFDALLLSIMQRADLLEVSVYLKRLFDMQDDLPVGYYLSAFYSFLPNFIWSEKPYPLSDDGTIWGEISVVAWQLTKGNTTGSLTAFGAITAYREGGWIWVPFNALLVGVSFGLIYLLLGRGGIVARWAYGVVFATACIKNVPPSFFQLLVNIASTINTVAFLLIFDKLLRVSGLFVFARNSSR